MKKLSFLLIPALLNTVVVFSQASTLSKDELKNKAMQTAAAKNKNAAKPTTPEPVRIKVGKKKNTHVSPVVKKKDALQATSKSK